MELLATHTYPNQLFAYPIPLAEINANSNIVQNEGYQKFVNVYYFNPATLAGFLLIYLYGKEILVAGKFVASGFLCYPYAGKQQNKNAR